MKKNYKGKCKYANLETEVKETEGFIYRVMPVNLPIPHKKGENPKQNKSEMTKISEKVKDNLMANQLFLW